MQALESIEGLESLPFSAEGVFGRQDFEDFLRTPHMRQVDARKRAQDVEAMRAVTARIRKQLRFIVHSVRCWRERHGHIGDPVRLRYSAYEGALCYSDLRRHWAYYRHAMRELGEMVI